MTKNVYFTLEVTINDGKEAEFDAVVGELCDSVQSEEGTLAYEWHKQDDGKTVFVYERYADSEAALTHLGGFGKLAPKIMPLWTIHSFNVFGDVSDALRAALADFKSPKWTQFAGFKR